MTFLHQIGILPALLVTLGGLLVMRSAEGDKAQRRLLFYLLFVGTVLLLILSAAILMTPAQDNRPFWPVSPLLTPAFVGVLALILLLGKQLAAIRWGGKLLAVLLAAGLIAMMSSSVSARWGLSYYTVPGVLVLVLGWAIGRRFPRVAIFMGIVLPVVLTGFNVLLATPSSEWSVPPPWLRVLFEPAILAMPGLIVVFTAVLLAHSLEGRGGKRALLALLASALFAYFVYAIFWASVWDQTSDGLTGLALTQPSSLVAVGAGMVMALFLRGRGRSAGLLFTMLAPLLLLNSFEAGWQVSYHALTETRAERIARALDAYYGREGIYPATLDALTPRYLLRIPQPVELQGESWCYQGGDDFYRLGAFSREFFSMPVKLEVYAAKGEPDSVWACENQLAELKERYYSPMADPEAMQPPIPTPLPPSEVATEAAVLPPVLEEKNTVWGSWSPDGAYFLLGHQEETGSATLAFLDGETGTLCQVDGSYSFRLHTVSLQPYHAWLAGGQMLLVDADGQMVLLTPCEAGARIIMPEAQQVLTEVVARNEANDRLLLRNADEFWIFDGRELVWRPIPSVAPNPYEAHWDNAAWQPDGELLAISRLNGREASDGSNLYIVHGESGEVVRSLPLAEANDQSAPRVDWLSPEELLLMSGGVLRILDFSSEPPQAIDVLGDLFQLDLDFPEEVGGHGWEVDWADGTYYLTVQANHPRNRAFYLYRSATDTVEVYEEDSHLLLRFPDGKLEAWTVPETEASDKDEFVLVDLVEGEIHPPLTIAGHTPRNYPRLGMAYLREPALLAVASSQGVSLHTLPDGTMSAFWALEGEGFAPFLRPAPNGSALVAIRDLGGVYWIPLP